MESRGKGAASSQVVSTNQEEGGAMVLTADSESVGSGLEVRR